MAGIHAQRHQKENAGGNASAGRKPDIVSAMAAMAAMEAMEAMAAMLRAPAEQRLHTQANQKG